MSPGAKKKAAEQAAYLQLQQFLDDWHYRLMNSSTGRSWTRPMALTAALDILAINGVQITPEEIGVLSLMEDSHLLRFLIDRMPEIVRENFHYLTSELQFLLSNATRIRKVVDSGEETEIQAVLEELDTKPMGQQILKRAVVQASKEVAHLKSCQKTWVSNMEERLDRLTHATQVADQGKEDLVKVEEKLGPFPSESRAKFRTVLETATEIATRTQLQFCFNHWLAQAKRTQAEKKTREDFEKRIATVEQDIADFKARAKNAAHQFLERKAKQDTEELLCEVLKMWRSQVSHGKRMRASQEGLAELDRGFSEKRQVCKKHVTQVLSRVAETSSSELLSLVFTTWFWSTEEGKKAKDLDLAVAEAETAMRLTMAKRKGHAYEVVQKMFTATATGLLTAVWQGWVQAVQESEHGVVSPKSLDHELHYLKGLKASYSYNACMVQDRMGTQIELNLCLRALYAWQTEAKVNRVDKYYTQKMESKRKQLNSVQSLFKRFAKELEEGLGNVEGDSSGRGSRSSSKGQLPGLSREGTFVSLPDIHAR